jgi:hypothetical protein
MLSYVKANAAAIRTRLPEAPLVIVLDWDSASKKPEFEKHLRGTDRAKVLVWPDSTFNPRLGSAFHGLERHLTDRLILEAGKELVGTKPDETLTIGKDELGVLKSRVLSLLQKGIQHSDLQHARPFIAEVLQTIRSGDSPIALSSKLTLHIPSQTP